MTLLAYRPVLTIALTDDFHPSGLAQDIRDDLRRIVQEIRALATPLMQVRSLPEAERLVSLAAPGYAELAKQATQLLSRSTEPAKQPVPSLVDSIRGSVRVPEVSKEQLQGTLESLAEYMNWFRRNYAGAAEDKQRALTPLVQQINDYVTRVEVAFTAIVLVLDEHSGSTPDAIHVLAEFADNCWTEVEDTFLGLAEDDEDDGETVPLGEVKAQLDL